MVSGRFDGFKSLMLPQKPAVGRLTGEPFSSRIRTCLFSQLENGNTSQAEEIGKVKA